MYIQAPLLENRRFLHHRFASDIEAEIKQLGKSDNWHAPLALASDYAICAGCFAACIYVSWWLYPVAILIIGARQRGISSILHESSHGVSASNRVLRALLGTVLTAYPIFQTYCAYKISHVITHHPHLGRCEHDADLRFFIEERVFEPQPPRWYFFRMVVLPLLGVRTWAYLKYLFQNRFKADDKNAGLHIPESLNRNRKREYVLFAAFWCAVIYAAYAVAAMDGLLYLVLFWVVPYLTFFQIIGWYIELSEHCTVIGGQNTDVFMASNRHSTGLERFLTGVHNDHHHLDHHLNPSTPFWNLPKAREARLRDPVYAQIDRETGGLFTRGFYGAPSALQRLLAQNRARHEALFATDAGQSARGTSP